MKRCVSCSLPSPVPTTGTPDQLPTTPPVAGLGEVGACRLAIWYSDFFFFVVVVVQHEQDGGRGTCRQGRRGQGDVLDDGDVRDIDASMRQVDIAPTRLRYFDP